MATNILDKIEAGLPSFTRLQKTAARQILDDPMDSAFSTVDQFARKAKISTATVVRFANAMGYAGYSEFQHALQDFLYTRHNPLQRLEKSMYPRQREDSVLSTICKNQLNLLDAVFNDKLESQIRETAECIGKANHVYTAGSRGSYSIAYYLCHNINRLYHNADILPETSRLPDYLSRIRPDDVLIIVNFPRYSNQMVSIAKYTKELGAKNIVITDSRFSPYTQLSDIIFQLPCSSNDYHNTLLPALLVSELLISYLIANNVKMARESLDALEPICQALGMYVGN